MRPPLLCAALTWGACACAGAPHIPAVPTLARVAAYSEESAS